MVQYVSSVMMTPALCISMDENNPNLDVQRVSSQVIYAVQVLYNVIWYVLIVIVIVMSLISISCLLFWRGTHVNNDGYFNMVIWFYS